MKWFLILVAVGVGFAILTDNMGGAKSATANYSKVLLNPSSK